MDQKPFVPEKTDQREFTLRLFCSDGDDHYPRSGQCLSGLESRHDHRSTYPAAVIGMALLKIMKFYSGREYCQNGWFHWRISCGWSYLYDSSFSDYRV
jgi:hypothetical protein